MVMDIFKKEREVFADRLFQCGAVRFGEFKLKLHEREPDAPLSPIYLSLRVSENGGPLTPFDVLSATGLFCDILFESDIEFDRVAGIPRAGEPFAWEVARISDKPLTRLIKEERDGFRKINSISADDCEPGTSVLLIDDLITEADTKKEAIDLCRSVGLEVAGILVLVDREQGGSDELKKTGTAFHSVFTLTELLDRYIAKGFIDEKRRDEVLSYIGSDR